MSSPPPAPPSTAATLGGASVATTAADSSVGDRAAQQFDANGSTAALAAEAIPEEKEEEEEEEGEAGRKEEGEAGRKEEGRRPLDEESQTTYGSWQAESPRPVDPDLSRALSLAAASSVHSVHIAHLKPHELRTISRLRFSTRDLEGPPPPPPRNPLLRAFRWWRSWAVPGLGMFVEAWMVFSVGNIHPLLAIQYPYCFGKEQPPECNQAAADSMTYIQVCGIILGMLVLGFCADVIGRKWGSRLTASIMLLGGALLTGSAGNDGQFLAMFLTSLFIFGLGVGGEYPVASSSAAERAEGSREMRRRRGETVVLTFSQQGWGNFANTLAILLLLAVQGATGAVVTPGQAQVTWRVQFAIGTAICAGLAAYRWIYLQESRVWKVERHDVAEDLAHRGIPKHGSSEEYWLVARFYWARIMAVCLTWLISNFVFYGQKLNQSKFIAAITGPNATLFTRFLYTLLNSGVALVGYYAAALLIDRRWYGRVRMQFLGFLMLFVLFLLQGALYGPLENNTGALQFLYVFASFWAQLGPNCTTFLFASEVYPTGVRSTFHGISAAVGKIGAVVAAAIFPHISARAAFYATAGASAVGCVTTLLFLPDTTGLDLHELDRMNRYMLAGQLVNYHGQAVNPRFLSWYERWRGYAANYEPERDMVHKHLQRHPHLTPLVDIPPRTPGRSRQTSRAASQWSRISRRFSRVLGAGEEDAATPRPVPEESPS